jgi:DNA-binding PadR family transcriptional regulator
MGHRGLGEFELLVLLAAARLGPENAHAVSIAGEIEERTGRPARRSAVYITLQRLEQKALVSSHLGDPRPERGGKARRLVVVEPEGAEAVRAARAALVSMWDGLDPAPRHP